MEQILRLRRIIDNIKLIHYNHGYYIEVYPNKKREAEYQFVETLRVFFKNFNWSPFFLYYIQLLPAEQAYIRTLEFIEDLILIEEVKDEYFLEIRHDQSHEAQSHA